MVPFHSFLYVYQRVNDIGTPFVLVHPSIASQASNQLRDLGRTSITYQQNNLCWQGFLDGKLK